jgi:hypothetical protein
VPTTSLLVDQNFVYGGQSDLAVTKPPQTPAVVKVVETDEEKVAKKKKKAEDAEKARVKELGDNLLAINRFVCILFVFSMLVMNLVLWAYLGS